MSMIPLADERLKVNGSALQMRGTDWTQLAQSKLTEVVVKVLKPAREEIALSAGKSGFSNDGGNTAKYSQD